MQHFTDRLKGVRTAGDRLAALALTAAALLIGGCANLQPAGQADQGLRDSSAPTAALPGGARTTASATTSAAPPATTPAATPAPSAPASATGVVDAPGMLIPRAAATRQPVTEQRAPFAPGPAAPISNLLPPSLEAMPSITLTEGNLWDRIRAGFAMPALPTPLVAEKERFYSTKPEYLQRMFQRGGRYLFYIVEEIEKRGMPTELALLPFVESAMNPVAMSSAQAAGLWQFIPSTGKAYDLQQDWWVDNRRDVVKSTQAALDYLQKIYAMHGNDWFLALASYNWGEGSVARAVKKNQAMGRPTDYLSLAMPNETRHYVPKLIALKNLLLNADTLGLKLPDLPNRPYFVTLEKTRPIDLQLAAQFARMSVEDFVALNPAHNRPVMSATRNNELKLPADRLDGFKAAMATHEADSKTFASWQPYTLKPGENLDALAQRSGISVAELRRANGLRENARIVAGTRLLLPQKGVADETRVEQFVAPRVYEQIDRPAQFHTVGKRESIDSIADRYQISAATLAAWNGLRRGVARGMRLLVQPAGTQTMLTTESGERSMVSQTTSRPSVPEPVAGSEPVRAAADESPRMLKVSNRPAAERVTTATAAAPSATAAARATPRAAARVGSRATAKASASTAASPVSASTATRANAPSARADARAPRATQAPRTSASATRSSTEAVRSAAPAKKPAAAPANRPAHKA